jgi:nucleoid-associated protein YgaU
MTDIRKRERNLCRKLFGTGFDTPCKVAAMTAEIVTRTILAIVTAAVYGAVYLMVKTATATKAFFTSMWRLGVVKRAVIMLTAFTLMMGMFLAPIFIANAEREIVGYEVVDYTVKSGDTVWDIAATTGLETKKAVDMIYWYNDIGTYIHPGQVLKVPVKK